MTPARPGFVLETALAKAARDGGYRLQDAAPAEHPNWLAFRSTTVAGALYLAGAGDHGPYFLGLSRRPVAQAITLIATDVPGPGVRRFTLPDLPALHEAVSHAWTLSRDLPEDLLAEFEAATAGLPRTTEAERQVVQRIGQDIFRDRLMRKWDGRCAVTGIAHPELLRASHIKPWADCATDAARLDPENGLLLSALWDAAFDQGLVTFEPDGTPRFSTRLDLEAKAHLAFNAVNVVSLPAASQIFLEWHRTQVFKS